MISVGFCPSQAEAAKRLGGGNSTGMQRQTVTPQKSAVTAPPAAPVTPAAPAGNRWLGPIAGLAAGVGLGYLFSQGGFGGIGSIISTLLIGLLVFGGVMLAIRFFMKSRAPMETAGGVSNYRMLEQESVIGQSRTTNNLQPGSNIPYDFDSVNFIKHAKLSFINLQKANDLNDIEMLRDMSTDEMFAVFKSQLDLRHGAQQHTEVVTLEAELLEVVTETVQHVQMHVASVRFVGMIKDDGETVAGTFEEVWNLQKPITGSSGWTLAGIQQTST
jgi:predicted lipid-binding transport protein (Tim44 family)